MQTLIKVTCLQEGDHLGGTREVVSSMSGSQSRVVYQYPIMVNVKNKYHPQGQANQLTLYHSETSLQQVTMTAV